jgi:short-subunit dehydrogenase
LKIVLLGATKGMGRELGRQAVAAGHQLFLLGRHADDVERSLADLRARAGSAGAAAAVGGAVCDLEQPDGFAAALDAADAALAGFDTVVVTAGMFASQEQLEGDLALMRRLVTVNYAHTVLFCEHVRQRLLARGGGTLAVFSSVAGDRGRKPVVIYGSSKAGLSAYLEGLDHRYHAAGLRVICVKPGFVKTGMTAGLKPPPFAGEPEAVARKVLARLERPVPVLYVPPMWRLVMAVIRRLPRFLMRRLNF